MLTDQELADKVVALGIKRPTKTFRAYGEDSWEKPIPYSEFVRDWRVAGALMEKCEVLAVTKSGSLWFVSDSWNFSWSEGKENLPRAIIEACVEALDAD